MPIRCALSLRPISDAEFDEIDRAVMGCAFASQNRLGRLCEEQVYENDVAARLRSLGFREVFTQEPLVVSYQEFTKRYRLDLVVNQMLYELKAATTLASEHDAQAIHYATLLGIDRVKLLNFRPHKVVGLLKRCPPIAEDRFQVQVETLEWQPLTDRCERLACICRELFQEWGAFLEVSLFEEALKHFCGGEEFCLRRVVVVRDGLELGTHRLPFHSDRVPFVVTAFTADLGNHEEHLRRLLEHTGIPGLQWFNFNHRLLQLKTVTN